MSFLRHGEIYHSDGGAIPQDRAPAHRNDEFPAGYSLAGCTPAEPASASPASSHLAGKPVRGTIEFQRTAYSLLTVCLSSGDHRSQPQNSPGACRLHSFQGSRFLLNAMAGESPVELSKLTVGAIEVAGCYFKAIRNKLKLQQLSARGGGREKVSAPERRPMARNRLLLTHAQWPRGVRPPAPDRKVPRRPNEKLQACPKILSKQRGSLHGCVNKKGQYEGDER